MKNTSSKQYFYSLGQRSRAYGWTKYQGEAFYGITKLPPYASIYFDKGYRGF